MKRDKIRVDWVDTQPSIPATVTPEIKALVQAYGQPYLPAVLPPDITRGPIGQCFDTCALIAVRQPKYRYVEGLLTNPDTGQEYLHSWLSTGLWAYDPTWRAFREETGEEVPSPFLFFGVSFPTAFVAEFMTTTGYQGILANRHRLPGAVEALLAKQSKNHEATDPPTHP